MVSSTVSWHRQVKTRVMWSQDVLFVSINNLAAGGPSCLCQVSTKHITIAWDNHTFHLNEMLPLRNQWIDENAAQLSISHQGCVCAPSGMQEHMFQLQPHGNDVPPAGSSFHLTIITLCHWQYEKRNEWKNKHPVRALSQFVPANITEQQPFSKQQA